MKKIHHVSIGMLSAISSLALQGAGCAVPVGSDVESTQSEEAPLYQGGNGNAKFDYKLINVCFESYAGDAAPTEGERALIRRAIENSWMRYSALTFTDWGSCKQGEYGIHIHLQDAAQEPQNYDWRAHCAVPKGATNTWGWPCADVGPAHSDGAHVNLTSTYDGQATSFSGCRTSGAARNDCLVQDTVHEFGHALGLDHEQKRPDSQCTDQNDSRTGGGKVLTAYDGQSVMNYCASPRAHNGNLTASDIFGIQRIYGRKAGGSIVSFDGRCLDIANGAGVNGHPAQTWQCLGGTQLSAANQRWYYQPANGSIGLYDFPGKVLDIAFDARNNGAIVQDFDGLDRAPSQTWSLPDAQIRGLGEMCLDIPAFTKTNGTQVWLWPCTGTTDFGPSADFGHPETLNLMRDEVYDNQKFTFEADGHIRLSGGFYTRDGLQKCLEAQGASRANGTPIVLADCNDSTAQRFRLWGNNAIEAFGGGSGKCVDVTLANLDTFDGAPGGYKLQVWDCNQRLNQQFSLFGQVRAAGNRCLDVGAWSRADGSSVRSWTCDAPAMTTKQAWELYL